MARETNKSGDKCNITNYRPISLLCSISKVLQRLVYDKIYEFVYNSISTFQFGFLKSHSCLQQLLIFIRKIYSSFNLDFRKAFDRVPHPELLHKLTSIGTLLKWFQC